MPFQSSIPSSAALRLDDLFPRDAKIYTANADYVLHGIKSGDLLVIDPTARPHRQSVVLATWHGGMTIRPLWKCSEGMEFRGVVLATVKQFT
jgi:hypothetical protein